ncbi:type II toxin-antitoxin system HicA family toxin [Mobilicoccus massiliensis]|uniref:type II toxin-antitoxin system HicA family toxin n=1 Tax=Mobilicoccus massiliensis TaxID=1522310 RepID=UPI0009E3843C|nr:hypothetical protein [Mobilicoccus massiliensis]
MTKPMKYRDLARRLRSHGCTPKPGKGDHEKWYCPCGKHMAVITRTRDVSPGVVDDTRKKLTFLPEGWMK